MTDLPQGPVKPGFLRKDQLQRAHGRKKPGFFGLA
jgi:hypothetical protein